MVQNMPYIKEILLIASGGSCCSIRYKKDDDKKCLSLVLPFTLYFQGNTKDSIEELRSSLSELKLPSEMDFKYK